jgi:hypothetical protein
MPLLVIAGQTILASALMLCSLVQIWPHAAELRIAQTTACSICNRCLPSRENGKCCMGNYYRDLI